MSARPARTAAARMPKETRREWIGIADSATGEPRTVEVSGRRGGRLRNASARTIPRHCYGGTDFACIHERSLEAAGVEPSHNIDSKVLSLFCQSLEPPDPVKYPGAGTKQGQLISLFEPILWRAPVLW